MKLIRFLLFIISVTFTSHVTAQKVYTTKTGDKYHKSSCHYLKYSKKQITLKKAKEFGYKACKVCKPTIDDTKRESFDESSLSSKSENIPKSSDEPSKKIMLFVAQVKKKRVRCKRMTKNTNGRCYQH